MRYIDSNKLKELISQKEKEFIEKSEIEGPIGDYNEAYLQEKITKARDTWKDVDVDKYMAELRGYELPETE